MGEIKSTLDLVMERTRHLTLTEEERRENALVEFRGSLNGLLQRYQDRVLNLDRVDREIRQLQEESGFKDGKILVGEVMKRLDPDGDYQPLLELLAETAGIDTAEIASLFVQYREAIASLARARTDMAKERLLKRGFTGTAVVPNLGADTQWTEERAKTREKFLRDIVHSISTPQ